MNSQACKGIYIHIPFCTSKCNYCDFYSMVQTKRTRVDYIKALCNQIVTAAGDKHPKINTVYIGGGTPSVLSYTDFADIFKALSVYNLENLAEITVECNPDSADIDFFYALKNLGVNRISMGAQSFVLNELMALGRRHSSDDIDRAFKAARNAGFDNISLDLMLAIPHQTKETLDFSLKSILSLDPEHISAYILKVEENTPFGKQKMSQPDEDIASAFYLYTSELLKENGYAHYEISNFAKEGKRAIHNAAYWQGKEYAAFGCGAHGYIDGKRFFYPNDISDFIDKNGIVSPEIEEILSEEDKQKEIFMLALRTSDGIKKESLTSEQKHYFYRLIECALAEEKSACFALTPKGFLVSNEIISNLL